MALSMTIQILYMLITKRLGKIICPEHESFMQSPSNHKRGNGCPSCAQYCFDPNKPAILYYFLDEESGLYKIGITNISVEWRFHGKRKQIKILMEKPYEIGKDAYLEEQRILKEFEYARCNNNSWENGTGRTEFFDRDVLLLDTKKRK